MQDRQNDRDGAPAVSADMFGEQTCIRQGKGAGGMKGISTNPEQVAVWIQSFGICSHLSQSFDDMYSDKIASEKTLSNRYKEEGEARRELDAEDRSKIVKMLWENTKPLMTESTLLYHIINGQVADEKVNVQDALKIGQAMCKRFSSSLPEAFNAHISHKVVTITFQKKGMKVSVKVVCDLESLFARLVVVGGQRKIVLSSNMSLAQSPCQSLMTMDASERAISQCLSSNLEFQFAIPSHQMLSLWMHFSSFITWFGHRLGQWQILQPAWDIGLVVITPKHLSSLTNICRCLPRTMRDKDEQGRVPQIGRAHV